MSLLELSPSVSEPALGLDELEEAFRAWVEDPVKPTVVELGPSGRTLSTAEFLRDLESSTGTLDPPASEQIGFPAGVTIAVAAEALLHATVAPDGPKCRSWRAASYYLRGLSDLSFEFEIDDAGPRFPAGVADAPRACRETGAETDETLMRMVALGEREAFAALRARMFPLVYLNVCRLLRDAAQARALTDEIFAEIRSQAVDFDPDRTCAQAWVLTVATDVLHGERAG